MDYVFKVKIVIKNEGGNTPKLSLLDEIAILCSYENIFFVSSDKLISFCRLVANALDTLSLPKGSAIAIDMQMTVTAVIIYLAIILAGYVVVSIADSFAPNEIATRLKIANAKAIFTQVKISCL